MIDARHQRVPMRHAAPALGAWASFAVGLLAARTAPAVPSWTWFLLAGVGAILAWRWRRWPCRAALAIAAAALGAGWCAARVNEAPADFLGRALDPLSREIVTVEGVVLGAPEIGPAQWGRFARFLRRGEATRFTIDVRRVRGRSGGAVEVSGRLRVRVEGALTNVRAGDVIGASGFLSAIPAPMNPGEIDGRPWARQDGVAGRLAVSGADHIERLSPEPGVLAAIERLVRARVGALRTRAASTLSAAIGDAGAPAGRSLARALLLGERDASLQDVEAAFMRVGVGHVLAISGLHLGALVWLAMLALRLTRDCGRLEPALVAAVVVLYVVVVPAETPVIRAAIMALGYLAALSAGRRYHPLGILAWTGIAVLIWRPLELWSAGYQLSFGVVGALIAFAGPLADRWTPLRLRSQPETLGFVARRRLTSAVAAAVCAWAVASPLIVHHMGVFSPLAIVASLLLVPLLTVLLGVGVATLLVTTVWAAAGQASGALLAHIATAMTSVTMWLDGLPATAAHLPATSAAWTAGGLLVAAGWLATPMWRRPGLLAASAVFALWSAALVARPVAPGQGAPLRLDTLAVSDGSCHILRARGGPALLWDCGSTRLWLGERTLPRAARTLGAWRVPLVVITHPNLDHYSTLLDMARPLGVRDALVSESVQREARSDPDGPVAHLLDSLRRMGVDVRVVRAGDEMPLGAATLRFLHPPGESSWRSDNDSSLVARVTVRTGAAERSVLLCGDIERPAIEAVTGAAPGLTADVVEAPHHGSAQRAAMDFVQRLDPAVVVQSTGPSRLGDERWDEVKKDRRWITTASDGAASVLIDHRGGIQVHTWGEARRAERETK